MFWTSTCPSSGVTTAVAASGLPSELGDSSAVGRGRFDRPDHDQQHCILLVESVEYINSNSLIALFRGRVIRKKAILFHEVGSVNR